MAGGNVGNFSLLIILSLFSLSSLLSHACSLFNAVTCLLQLHCCQFNSLTGFPRSWKVLDFLGVQFPGSGKSWKMGLVLESPGNLSARSWKVLEFSRL